MRIRGWLMLGLMAGALSGCGPVFKQCTLIAVSGLGVTVTDAATGQPICAATVTATEGSYGETLRASGDPACGYSGATERKGTYTVSASKSGYATATQSGVVVTADECHVHPVQVTLTLSH
jgi:hypothetical protein